MFASTPEEQEAVYSVVMVDCDVCIHGLLCKMVSVVFTYTGHLSVSTLHPALTGFITKKMSGCEEKQEDMKRSAGGQCTKNGRKLEVKTNLLFYFVET